MCCSTRLAHSLARPLARRQRVPFTSSWGTVIRSFPCSPSPLMKPWTEPGSGRSPSVPLDPSPACRLLVRCRGYVPFPLLLCGEILAGGGRISWSVRRPTSRRRVAVAIAFARFSGRVKHPGWPRRSMLAACMAASAFSRARVVAQIPYCPRGSVSAACRGQVGFSTVHLLRWWFVMYQTMPLLTTVPRVLVGFGRGRGGGDCGFIIHRPAASRARSWRRLLRGDGCPAAVAPGH